jgi:hypothetical protein
MVPASRSHSGYYSAAAAANHSRLALALVLPVRFVDSRWVFAAAKRPPRRFFSDVKKIKPLYLLHFIRLNQIRRGSVRKRRKPFREQKLLLCQSLRFGGSAKSLSNKKKKGP